MIENKYLAKTGGKRHLGIDLLRIVAMFMVCVLHVNYKSGGMQLACTADTGVHLGVNGLQSLCLIAVNLYAMITGYVSVMGTWKPSRYFNLWFQVVFYTVGIYGLFHVLGRSVCPELEPAGGLMPMFFPVPFASAYWYFTAYTALFLMMPYVNPYLRSMGRGSMGSMVLLLLVVLAPSSIVQRWPIFSEGYNAAWLLVMYVAGAYVRMFPMALPRWLVYAGACAGVSVTMVSLLVRGNVMGNFLFPGVILSSVCVFHCFVTMEVRQAFLAGVIKMLAPFSFGVYLLHVHPCSWKLMTTHLPILFEQWHYGWWLFILCPIVLYVSGSIVDASRAGLFRLCCANALADAMERGLKCMWNGARPLLLKHFGPWFEGK